MEPVSFGDRDGGLWLSYENYRALERNIIAMREYARLLETVIDFYREGGDAD
jgi:nitrous oxidase accessory protein NosD